MASRTSTAPTPAPRPAGTNGNASASTTAQSDRSFFEAQREELIDEIAANMEHVLQNINKLNRSLEGVIAVGNEFGAVEALWSQFEGVMARDPEAGDGDGEGGEGEEEEEGDEGGEEEGDTTVR